MSLGQEIARMIEAAFRDFFKKGIPGSAITGKLSGSTIPAPGASDRGGITSDQDLDNNARVGVRKNSTGSVFERRRLNLIEGSNVTLTVADDSGNEEVDITIAASGGGGSLTVGDGGTPVTSVDTIIFDGATVTDDGGGQVTVEITGGGGGVTTAEYVTTASNGSLSAEVVIPGLAGAADRAGIGGTGFAQEYDTGTSGLTWSAAPDTESSDGTVPSHLYVTETDTSARIGMAAYAPAGDWDARTKISIGFQDSATSADFYTGLLVNNSDDSVRVGILIRNNSGSVSLECYTYSGGFSLIGSAVTAAIPQQVFYLRITRVGTAIGFFYSHDGLVWRKAQATTFSITAAKIGYYFHNNSGGPGILLSDWLRATG